MKTRRGRAPVLLAALGACIALVGAASWWLFVAHPATPPAVEEPRSERALERASVPSDAALVELPRADAETRAPAKAAEKPPAAEPETAPGERHLRIVDASGGEPIAGARVWILDPDGLRSRGADDLGWLAVLGEERGKRFTSDAFGLAPLAGAGRKLVAVASTPPPRARFGASWIEELDESRELELFTDGPLVVFAHAEDASALAGVPLVIAEPDERFTGRVRRAEAITDADGRATFAHGRAWIERARASGALLVVDGAFPRICERALSPSDAGATVSLEVPAFGSIDVRVLDFEDRAARRGAAVLLLADGLELPFPSDFARQPVGGRVAFPVVAVGVEARFQAYFQVAGQPFGPIAGEARIARAGERAELVLGGSRSTPILVFRALDESWSPLAGTALLVQPVEGRTPLALRFPSSAVPDRRGLVRLPVTGSPIGGAVLRVAAPATGPRKHLAALLELPRELSAGERHLGDLVLRAEPTLASGRVVDQFGDPIPDAAVRVFTRATQWELARSELLARTNERGEFSIDGSFDGELCIRAAINGCRVSDDLTFRRGAAGLELVLDRFAWLEGTLLIDAGRAASDFKVVWTVDRPLGEPRSATISAAPVEGSSDPTRVAIRDRKLTAGTGRLDLLFGSSTIASLDPLVLRAGRNDGVLRDLDARGRVHDFELTLRGCRGEFVRQATIQHRPSGSREPWQTWHFAADRRRLAATAPELDLSIAAPGLRDVHLERVRSGTEIVLDDPIGVRLELVGGNPLAPRDALELRITLREPRDARAATPSSGAICVAVDAAGRAAAAFPAPGTYAVAYAVTCASSGASGALDETSTLEISLHDDGHVLLLAPPRGAIEKLYAGLLDAPAAER